MFLEASKSTSVRAHRDQFEGLMCDAAAQCGLGVLFPDGQNNHGVTMCE